VTLVVDACVAIKWSVREVLHDEAIALLRGKDPLRAPDLIFLEVANVAWRKSRDKDIPHEQIRSVISIVREAIEHVRPSITLIDRALEIASTLNHPIYDCLYVACAEEANGVLVTSDAKLCRAAVGTFFEPIVRFLGEEVLLPCLIRTSTLDRIVRAAEKATRGLRRTADPFSGTSPQPDPNEAQRYFQSPSRVNFINEIDGLTVDERADLLVLKWIGEGEKDDWQTLRERALRASAESDGSSLVEQVGLAKSLRKGLGRLRERRVTHRRRRP
jgi:predicted nucleic acid-binding protein